MTNQNQIDLELIDRYLAGEASPAEQARVREAAESDPRIRELIAALPAASRPPEVTSWDADRAWARLQAGEPAGEPANPPARGPRTMPWLRLAALLVVGLALVLVWRSYTRPPTSSAASQSYSAAAGTPLTVSLADGTTVTLAPHSTLRAPARFPERSRDVYLDGEAFFQVTHDAARPYIVHTRDSQVEVLGTSFNVAAYADAPIIEVVVESGRVQLSADATSSNRVLRPGELGRLDAAGVISVEAVNVEQYTSWRRGLTFTALRFEDAVPRLERWFGVQIEIADRTLADQRLTVVFGQQELADVLDALATGLNARYERTANGIVFHSLN